LYGAALCSAALYNQTMPLPILQLRAPMSREDLLRLYSRAELHWSRHVAQDVDLDAGTALANAQLAEVSDANRLLDASIPQNLSAADAVALVEAHYAATNSRCRLWALNASAAPAQREALAAHLLGLGYVADAVQVMHLRAMPAEPIAQAVGLKIFPARASYRHVRQLAEESAGDRAAQSLQLARTWPLHLDDPHTDALLAMRDGAVAGYVAVLAAGDTGAIMQLFVSVPFRRQGIGRTLMVRALEICRRSLFHHVLLGVEEDNAAAQSLYASLGFAGVGRWVAYRAPWAT
jgi:ribosomal protein S18 acetylase RimI-like enzyme